jgi:hypothetical protein
LAKRPLRIAAFSGALGDWREALSAAVRGEPVDVLVGDYLAEVTMARIAAGFLAGPAPLALRQFYCDVFRTQLIPELEAIAARGLKVVVNAGAFNPAGLAAAVRSEVVTRGLPVKVAHTRGDNLLPRVGALAAQGALANLDTGRPLGALAEHVVAANAYIGGWGIAAALAEGADIVICGRVADASLVAGPAAWWHDWRRDDFDRLAGAVAAGHVIECGAQATGGNFSGFIELGAPTRIGFPIAEIAEDGSSIITKRAADEGAVTVDTVTAQLLYEIQGADYLNPDVVLHVDTVQLAQDGANRVRLSAIRGGPAPETTKLGCFYPNGWKTTFWAFATGLDAAAKVAWLDRQMRTVAERLALDEYHFDVLGQPAEDPATQAEATVAIRIAASAAERAELGELLGGLGSFGMGSLPGFYAEVTGEPDMRVDFWPALVPQSAIAHEAVLDDGRVIAVAPPPTRPLRAAARARTSGAASASGGETRRLPLGQLIHARTGDKGANANLGVWVRKPEAWEWLRITLTAAELSRLLGLHQDIHVERHEFPNLQGLLFVLRGCFGVSGSGNAGLDPLGKAIGEFLRARTVVIPEELARVFEAAPGGPRPESA